MKYYRFTGDCGYCGTDYEEILSYDYDVTKEELDQTLQEIAYEQAEMYSYLATGWEGEFEEEEEEEMYYDDVRSRFSYEEVTEEEYLQWREENE